MLTVPHTVRVFLYTEAVDLRKSVDGLSGLVTQAFPEENLLSGHLFVFRGRKANLIKIVFWDGTGLCLFTKRLEQGVFLWPPTVEPGRTLAFTAVQLSALLEVIDWRCP